VRVYEISSLTLRQGPEAPFNRKETTNMGKSDKKPKSSPGSEARVDDANISSTQSGAKSAIFGLSIDSIGQSNPTHMIPYLVRDILMRFISGAHVLPWYNSEDDDAPCVARALQVSTAEAEAWMAQEGALDNTHGSVNSFAMYSDVPMRSDNLARLSWWRFASEAAELDVWLKAEPQVYAVDQYTQLLVESFDYHFSFLANVDKEYHRMRGLGPLGEFNESAEESAWYNMYHHWRDIIHDTYLVGRNGNPPQIVLPVGFLNSNWTILDVLGEIIKLMVEPGTSTLRKDIFLTVKGIGMAKTGATLGIIDDASYLDNDGNVRFYMPHFEIHPESQLVETEGQPDRQAITTEVPAYAVAERALTLQGTPLDPRTYVPYAVLGNLDITPNELTGAGDVQDIVVGVISDRNRMYGTGNVDDAPDALGLTEVDRTGRTSMYERITGGIHAGAPLSVLPMTMSIIDLPQTGELTHPINTYGVPAGTMHQPMIDGVPAGDPIAWGADRNYAYWRGFSLNLVDLIEGAITIGRALEPEVAEGFLPAFGIVSDVSSLAGAPTSLSSRRYDDLFNMYNAQYSYNENPIRMYSASHLGPIETVIGADPEDYVVAGVQLVSVLAGANVSVRERYWLPPTLGAEGITNALNHLTPNAIWMSPYLGHVAFTGDDSLVSHGMVNQEFAARTLGAVQSMLTKAEKPVIVPAGVAAGEEAYASGAGLGMVQLISELLSSGLGGEPQFGLGHNGFTDWSSEGDLANHPACPPTSRMDATPVTDQAVILGSWSAIGVENLLSEVMQVTEAVGLESTEVVAFNGVAPEEWELVNQAWPTSMVPQLKMLSGQGALNHHWRAADAEGAIVAGFPVLGDTQVSITTPELAVTSTKILAHANDQAYQHGLHRFNAQPNGGNDCFISGQPGMGNIFIEDKLTSVRYLLSTGEVVEMFTPLGWNNIGWAKLDDENGTGLVHQNGGSIPLIVGAQNPELSWSVPTQNGGENLVIMSPRTPLMECVTQGLSSALAIDRTRAFLLDHDWAEPMGVTMVYTHTMWSGVDIQDIFDIGISSTEYILSVDEEVAILDNTYYQRNWCDGHQFDQLVEAQGTRTSMATLTYVDAPVEAALLGGMQLNPGDPFVPGASAFWRGLRQPYENGAIVATAATVIYGLDRPDNNRVGGWLHNANHQLSIYGEVNEGWLGAEPASLPTVNNLTQAAGPDWQHMCSIEPGLSPGEVGVLAGRAYLPLNDTNHLNTGSSLVTASGRAYYYGTAAMAGTPTEPTWIIPDDPEQRMVYRPHRRIVDAAIAREQKRFFLPTHENYGLGGGPLGLPIYGEPHAFRMMELAMAGQLDQYILEPAATKTRLVDMTNRNLVTFSKVTVADPQTGRHYSTEVMKAINLAHLTEGAAHTTGVSGEIYTRDFIRYVQSGRQQMRMANGI